jgi:HEAT repeat protein
VSDGRLDGAANPPEWVLRRDAARDLFRTGDYAGLLPVLRDPYPRVAAEAAQALGRAGYVPAVPALIECLHAKSYTLRAQAAYALREIGDERAVEPLISLLNRLTTSPLRAAVANALGSLGDERALPALKRLTEDENNRVRNTALGAVFRIEVLPTITRPTDL